MVTDVYKKVVLWASCRETARCRCKSRSKFIAASRGSPHDSTASCTALRVYCQDCIDVVEFSGYTQTTKMNIAATSTTNVMSSNCSTNASNLCANTTQATNSNNHVGLLLPVGVITVIVLASACLLLGVVYGYVYFTRMSGKSVTKPRRHKSARQQHADQHHHHDSGISDPAAASHRDDADANYTTHMFLFRKHHSLIYMAATWAHVNCHRLHGTIATTYQDAAASAPESAMMKNDECNFSLYRMKADLTAITRCVPGSGR